MSENDWKIIEKLEQRIKALEDEVHKLKRKGE